MSLLVELVVVHKIRCVEAETQELDHLFDVKLTSLLQFLANDGQCLVYWHACEQGGYIVGYQLLARRHIKILQCVSQFFDVLDAAS